MDLEPFLAVLDEGADPARQAAVLRLLRGRCDPRLLERAEALAGSSHTDLAALARQALEDCAETPEAAVRPGHDLVLVHVPAHREVARELAGGLERRGVKVFETADLEADLETVVDGVRAVAVLVGGPEEKPWGRPELEACLEILDGAELPLVPTFLPGSEEEPELPASLAWTTPVDLRAGLGVGGFEALEGALLRLEPRPAAAVAAVGPVLGEVIREPLTGMQLLWIPGASFQMGGKGIYGGKPIHRVRVSPFWFGETPVTNRQYGVFLEKTGHREPALWRDRRFSDPDQPVVAVTWHDSVAFCEWLGEILGLEATLPSEAQWEFAARGTDGRDFPWGDEEPDTNLACFGLDYREGKPARAGSFPAGRGPFGTLDQAGNVWEWCLDVWDENAYEKRSEGENRDPVVSEGDDDEVRVLRGGGWFNSAEDLRAAVRLRFPASGRVDGVGFRVSAAPASR